MSRAALFAAVMMWAGPALAQTAYFSAINDLPIPHGLQETSERFEFSDSTARIVGARARGPAAAEQVRAFYNAVLPALGWALSIGSGGENETVYLRGREQLSLSFFQRAGELEVQVLVLSRSPPRD